MTQAEHGVACWPRHLHVTSTQRVDAQACHSQEGDIRCDIPSAIADMFSASSCRPCLHQAPLLVHAHDTVFAIAAMSSSCRPCHRPCRPHAPGGVHMPQFLSCANVAVSSVAANASTSIRHSIRHGEFSFISSAISSISTSTPEIRRPSGFHTPLRACALIVLARKLHHACMHVAQNTHTHTHTHTRRSICAGSLNAYVAHSLNGSYMAVDVFLSLTVNIVCCLGSERHAHVRERTDVTGLTGKTPNTDVRQVASVFPVVVIVFVFVVVCVCVCVCEREREHLAK